MIHTVNAAQGLWGEFNATQVLVLGAFFHVAFEWDLKGLSRAQPHVVKDSCLHMLRCWRGLQLTVRVDEIQGPAQIALHPVWTPPTPYVDVMQVAPCKA